MKVKANLAISWKLAWNKSKSLILGLSLCKLKKIESYPWNNDIVKIVSN
jgi:hypothetical protein